MEHDRGTPDAGGPHEEPHDEAPRDDQPREDRASGAADRWADIEGFDDVEDFDDFEGLGDTGSLAGRAPSPPGTNTALPPKIEAWRRRSAAGAILTGFALGLQEALEKKKEEPSIVMETSGEPPKDLPVEADFEYGRPRQSVVQIRPWLLGENADTAEVADPPASSKDRTEPTERAREDRDDS